MEIMFTDFRLKVFYSVAKNLSFTIASRELFISQPAVSKHIQELEATFQQRLFERKGHTILLTSAGRLLLRHAEKLLLDYQQLDYDMHFLQNECCGELRLGASTTISQYVLPPLLAKFLEKFPKVSLSLFNGNSYDVEQALQDYKIDLGLVEGNLRQTTLKYTDFQQDELVAIVSTVSPYATYDEFTLEQFKATPLVLRERGSGTLDVFETALSVHNLRLTDLNVLLYLGSTESIKSFIDPGNGMAVVSIRSIDKDLLSNRFHIIELPFLRMERSFSFVSMQGEQRSLPQLFMQFVTSYKF